MYKQAIAVNARCLTRPISGVERYTLEIAKRMPGPRMIQPRRRMGRLRGTLWEQIVLPLQIKKGELLWSPANAGPWIVSHQIITLHDAAVFDGPEWFHPAFAAWTRISWGILSHRVKKIITVSRFSKRRLMECLQIPEEKICVVYNGVAPEFQPQTAEKVEAVKKKHAIEKPYLLFVGTLEPRKNLKNLLKAWKLLKPSKQSLLIVGRKNTGVFSNTAADATMIKIRDEDLPAIYTGASACIVPSFYEGFGLTTLEAQACGTPLIASDIPVFREILGETAIYTDPQNPHHMAGVIQRVLEDKSLADDLRHKGLQNASRYTWDESARQTGEILRDAS